MTERDIEDKVYDLCDKINESKEELKVLLTDYKEKFYDSNKKLHRRFVEKIENQLR